MPWKEATASNDDTPSWGKEVSKDTPIQGVYKSKKTFTYKGDQRTYFSVEVEKVKTEEGKEYSGPVKVYADAVIGSRFEEIPEGSLVELTFLGQKKGESGFKYNDYRIRYDDTNVQSGDEPAEEKPANEDKAADEADIDELFPNDKEEDGKEPL